MKRFICILFGSFLMILYVFSVTASAAEAVMEGSIKGDTATFVLTVTDSRGVGGFDGDFTITGGKVTDVSGGYLSSFNGNKFLLVMKDAEESVSMTITCKVTGDTVKLSADNILVVDDNGDEIGTTSVSATAVVSEETTKNAEDTTKDDSSTKKSTSSDSKAGSDETTSQTAEKDNGNGAKSPEKIDDQSTEKLKTNNYLIVIIVAIVLIVALVFVLLKKKDRD